jgi:hypothetical protein
VAKKKAASRGRGFFSPSDSSFRGGQRPVQFLFHLLTGYELDAARGRDDDFRIGAEVARDLFLRAPDLEYAETPYFRFFARGEGGLNFRQKLVDYRYSTFMRYARAERDLRRYFFFRHDFSPGR